MKPQHAVESPTTKTAHHLENMMHQHGGVESASKSLLNELNHMKPGEMSQILHKMERDAMKSHNPADLKHFEKLLHDLEKDAAKNPREHKALDRELHKLEHSLTHPKHGHGSKVDHQVAHLISGLTHEHHLKHKK